MIFAAGFGTRMGALTRDRPKPLIEVAGRPLLDHALAQAEGRASRIVVNAHYHADQIAAHLAGWPGVQLSHETPEILDTGGGLRRALPMLGAGPVWTLNSDAVWTGANPLDQLAAAWDPARMDALLLLVPGAAARGHKGRGDFLMAPDGRLARKGDTGGPVLIYSGAQIIRTGRLADIPETVFSLNRIWDRMLEAGRIFGAIHRGGWADVGAPEGIAAAEAMLEAAQDG